MNAPGRHRMLSHVGLLLMTFYFLTCGHSQGAGDVCFSLRNTTYHNNSLVTLEDIGVGDNGALLCRTNPTACCQAPYTGESGSGIGNWYFPSGARVHSDNWNTSFYRNRGQMVVRLNRKRGGEDGIYRCVIPDSMNVPQTIYIGVYTMNSSTGSPIVTGLTLNDQSRTLTCTSTGGPATNVTWRRDGVVITLNTTHQQTKRLVDAVNGTYQTVLTINSSVSQDDIVGTYTCTVENVRGESSGTVVVPASTPTLTDRATTTSVIAVITTVVFIVIVVIVIGVVILMALKKSKQRLVISNLQNVTMENEATEMKLKQEETTRKEGSSSADQPLYAEIEKEAPPKLPSKSDELIDRLNPNSTLPDGYSEIALVPNDNKHTLPTKPPRQVNLSVSMSEEKEFSPRYQDVDQHPDSPITTVISQGNDIYTVPDTSSHTVDHDNGIYETVYSEPIQPSLFTDTVGSPSDSEDLHPYAPVYTIPINLPKSDKVLLKVFGSNIRDIRELGMGQFGMVILAETVGLSPKDLRLSESDDDKSKSTLVAVKKLKSDASRTTKEAFEKEVNFMSRLTHRNVICILGVCYEDTPFIMMEYMEKGDLNQHLQKFKTLSTTDSEPQGQITTSTLVHMTTQIASAMKYLASHNFVHRDLATRNCLVGPNYLVKISDFGMSRSLYDSHYYRIHGRFALPVRWMAFECFYGKFSQKSDVWAFGVTMWEIFTLAKEQPYNDMSDKQVVEDALKGKNRQTLARPNMCPLEVYKIMLECWAHNSKQRATFEELFQLLTSIHIDE